MSERTAEILKRMSTREKIGQLNQVPLVDVEEAKNKAHKGEIGSVILAHTAFAGSEETERACMDDINEIQQAAIEGNGIPVIVGRDVIHGYGEVFPIPLAMAASFNIMEITMTYPIIKKYTVWCQHYAKEERGCYDEEIAMWYRDERFLPDKMLTASGKKVFWGRGNGWVLAGLARTLEVLPKDNKYYNEYLKIFKDMSKALLKWQQKDGFWRTSIIDPQEFDVPETSGTVLILYAYMLGINLGILEEQYFKAVEKGFNGLNKTAVFEDGKIGYVQVVADRPGPVDKNASNDYAIGTYLLLCSEIIKYIDSEN